MIYELRVYHAVPGRMAELVTWMGRDIVPIITRLGFRLVAGWEGIDPGRENEMTYILAWESMEERDAGFKALNADPEFIATFTAIRANGKPTESITKTFLQPTDWSPMR